MIADISTRLKNLSQESSSPKQTDNNRKPYAEPQQTNNNRRANHAEPVPRIYRVASKVLKVQSPLEVPQDKGDWVKFSMTIKTE